MSDYSTLSDLQLRSRILNLGGECGPVTPTTRPTLERKLARLEQQETGSKASNRSTSPSRSRGRAEPAKDNADEATSPARLASAQQRASSPSRAKRSASPSRKATSTKESPAKKAPVRASNDSDGDNDNDNDNDGEIAQLASPSRATKSSSARSSSYGGREASSSSSSSSSSPGAVRRDAGEGSRPRRTNNSESVRLDQTSPQSSSWRPSASVTATASVPASAPEASGRAEDRLAVFWLLAFLACLTAAIVYIGNGYNKTAPLGIDSSQH